MRTYQQLSTDENGSAAWISLELWEGSRIQAFLNLLKPGSEVMISEPERAKVCFRVN